MVETMNKAIRLTNISPLFDAVIWLRLWINETVHSVHCTPLQGKYRFYWCPIFTLYFNSPFDSKEIQPKSFSGHSPKIRAEQYLGNWNFGILEFWHMESRHFYFGHMELGHFFFWHTVFWQSTKIGIPNLQVQPIAALLLKIVYRYWFLTSQINRKYQKLPEELLSTT